MKMGFTGTREGMTDAQKATFSLILHHCGPREFHHGDCKGADADAHVGVSVVSFPCKIVIHPPENGDLRASCAGEVRPVKGYFARNRDIVAETDALVACPKGPDTGRGGTWYTINYARARGKPVLIVWPDGRYERERWSWAKWVPGSREFQQKENGL